MVYFYCCFAAHLGCSLLRKNSFVLACYAVFKILRSISCVRWLVVDYFRAAFSKNIVCMGCVEAAYFTLKIHMLLDEALAEVPVTLSETNRSHHVVWGFLVSKASQLCLYVLLAAADINWFIKSWLNLWGVHACLRFSGTIYLEQIESQVQNAISYRHPLLKVYKKVTARGRENCPLLSLYGRQQKVIYFMARKADKSPIFLDIQKEKKMRHFTFISKLEKVFFRAAANTKLQNHLNYWITYPCLGALLKRVP